MEVHELYMKRCLELAQKGGGYVAPNPMVGAVLVHDGRIIGEGWHQQFGKAHAEVNCLQSVSEKDHNLISGSTLYVNLEPCAHYGKTPLCEDKIIEHKIPKVVIGSIDPFSQVSGKGIERLKQAGVEVLTGILQQDCRQLNRRFFTVQEKKRPYIILKWAQSAEGFIAPENGARTQLSNATSQKLVHKMRSEEAAVLVGYNTALKDNPVLNNRYWTGHQPLRIVLDFEDQLPASLNIFQPPQKTIVFNFYKNGSAANKQWIQIDPSGNKINEMLSCLTGAQSGFIEGSPEGNRTPTRSVQSVLVEGGSKTLQLFIDAGIWDEALIFKTPVCLGTGIPAPFLTHSRNICNFNLQEDAVSLQVHEQNNFYL